MPRRTRIWTLSVAGLLILALLGGTVLGHGGVFALAGCLPAASLELPAPDLAAGQPAGEPHCSPLEAVLAAAPGRAPPSLPA